MPSWNSGESIAAGKPDFPIVKKVALTSFFNKYSTKPLVYSRGPSSNYHL